MHAPKLHVVRDRPQYPAVQPVGTAVSGPHRNARRDRLEIVALLVGVPLVGGFIVWLAATIVVAVRG